MRWRKRSTTGTPTGRSSNTARLLEPLGYVPPAELEAQYHTSTSDFAELVLKQTSLLEFRGDSMASSGVPTAEHTVCALDAGVYETARFDRVCHSDGRVARLHAEDGCQLTGKRPSAKYAQTGGPTYADLTAALRRFGTDPGSDMPLLFCWAVANLALGNRDAHAKNVSILRTADGALRLAPAYDVVCTMAYTKVDAVLPLLFAGTQHLSQLDPAALKKAARSFGITPALANDLVADVCDR